MCRAVKASLRRHLFAGGGDAGVGVPDLVALVQDDVVPVPALQGVLHVPHGRVRGDEDAVARGDLRDELLLQQKTRKNNHEAINPVLLSFLNVVENLKR